MSDTTTGKRERSGLIVGCYSLHLYCENRPCKGGAFRPAEYTRRTETMCLREARRDGWKVDKRTGQSECPACRKATGDAA